ncbi:hypothetical protein RUM43_008409 [Polyplax serrata]|uniref:Uncharacterized protein n=1 Tax=Polyplax serrata TaxID=468196 RepID=A0AAN8PYY1_POLSC
MVQTGENRWGYEPYISLSDFDQEVREWLCTPKSNGDVIAYLGFDLEHFIKAMIRRGRKSRREIRDIKREGASLTLIGALRGNNIENIKKKSHNDIVVFLNKMTPVCGLMKSPVGKDSATLSRFAIAHSADVVPRSNRKI